MALGEASVKVVADTRGFRQEVRAAVEASENSAEIDITANIAKFRADLARATRERSARIHVEPTGLVAFRAAITAATNRQRVRVHVEPVGLPAFRAAIVASMRGTNPKIPVLPSVNRGTWRAVINAAIAGMSVRVRVEPDVEHFRGALTRSLSGTQIRPVAIPIRFDTGRGGQRGIDRLLATNTGALGNVIAAGLGGDVGHIIHSWGRVEHAIRNIGLAFRQLRGLAPAVGRSLGGIGRGIGASMRAAGASFRSAFSVFSGTGFLSGIQSGLRSVLSTFRQVGSFVGELSQRLHVVGGAFLGLAGAVGQAISPFVQFVGALTALSGAAAAAYTPLGGLVQAVGGLGAGIAAMPAAISIAVAGLALMKFALAGVGDAMRAALTKNDEIFERVISGLSKTQQSFARGLRSSFKPVQASASEQFLSQVTRAMDALKGTSVGDAFKTGIDAAAQAMGRLASASIRFFGTATGVRLLQQSFAGLRDVFDGLAAGMPTLLTGFSDAVNSLLGSTGGIRTTLQSVTERFGAFLSRMALSGAINRGWEQFTQTLRLLGSLGANLVRTFNNITNAMRGASPDGRGPLGALADGMERIAKASGSVAGMRGMISFFGKLRSAGEAVWLVLKRITQAFGAFASGALSGAGFGGSGAGGGIAAVATSLSQVFERALPTIEEFGQKVGAALRSFADSGGLRAFVENLGAATAGATILAAKLLQLAGAAAKFFQNLFSGPGTGGDAFLSTFSEMGNAVAEFAANLGKLLAPIGSALVGAFKLALPVISAVSGAIKLFAAGLNKLGPLVTPITQVAAAFLAMQGAKLVLLALAAAITSVVIPAIIAMTAAVRANPMLFALTAVAALATTLITKFSDVGTAAEKTAAKIAKIGGTSDASLRKAKAALSQAKSERGDNTLLGSEGSFWSLTWDDDDKFKGNVQAAEKKIDDIYAERKARQKARTKEAIRAAAAQAKEERDAYNKAYGGVFEGIAGDMRKSLDLQPEKLFPDLKTARVGLPKGLASKLKEGITRDMKEVNKVAQEAAQAAIKAGKNTGRGQDAYTALMEQFSDAPPNVRAAAQKAWGNSIRKSLGDALKNLDMGKDLNAGQKKLVQDFYDQFNQIVITEGKNAGKTISKSLVNSLAENLDLGKMQLGGPTSLFDASKSGLTKLFPALKDMDKNLTDNLVSMIKKGFEAGALQSEGDIRKFGVQVNDQITKALQEAATDKGKGKKKISPKDYFVSAEDLPKDLKPMTDQINNAIREALTGKDADKKKKNKIKLEVDADTAKILEQVGSDSKFFNDLKSELSSTAKNASKGMTDGMGKGLNSEFKELAKSMVGEGSQFRSKLGSDIKGAMSKMTTAAVSSIKSNKGKIKTELGTIPKMVDAKSAFASSLKAGMKSSFSAAMDAAVSAIRSKKGAVQSALNEIKALASSTVSVSPTISRGGGSGGGGGGIAMASTGEGRYLLSVPQDGAEGGNTTNTTTNTVTLHVNSRASSPDIVARQVMRSLAQGLA